MSRVLIVSSDCHAGLPDGRYRDYLDEDYREAYDRQLARLREQGDKLRAQVSQFLDEREEELAEGLTGAWDSAQRTKELDADGITAEVLFPDGTTGGNAPPFGAGLAPHAGARPERLLAGDHAALADYRQQHRLGARSHPTDEHYLPARVAAGAAGPGARVSFPVEGFEHGTLSLRCARFD